MNIDWYYNNDGCRDNEPMQENQILVQVPFIGTYEALDRLIDSEVECERDYRESEGMTEDYTLQFNMRDFLISYVAKIADITGLQSLRFHDMESPAYYNFSTDRIFCAVDENELYELYKEVRKDSNGDIYYRAEVGEATTPRDGFMPYYRAADCFYSSVEELIESPACLLALIVDAKCSMWLEYEEQCEHDLTLSAFELYWRFYDDMELYSYLEESTED